MNIMKPVLVGSTANHGNLEDRKPFAAADGSAMPLAMPYQDRLWSALSEPRQATG